MDVASSAFFAVKVVASLLLGCGFWKLCSMYTKFKTAVANGTAVGPPPTFPGNVSYLARYGQIEGWTKALEEGDTEKGISSLWFTSLQFVIVTHWEDIKKVFPGSIKNVPGEPNINTNIIHHWLGNGSILMSYENSWKVKRRIMSPAFHFHNVKGMATDMLKNINRLMEFLDSSINAHPNRPIDMDICIRALTLDIIGKTAFDVDLQGISSLKDHSKQHPIGEAFAVLLREVTKRQFSLNPLRQPRGLWIPTPANRRFNKAFNTVKAEIQRVIDKRKQTNQNGEKSHTDFLDLLLAAHDPESGIKFTDGDLNDNLRTVMFAGQDTTNITLDYTLYCVATNPAVQKKLQTEVDEAFVDFADDREAHELASKLPYCTMVIKEALRLYPPIYVTGRTAPTDLVFGGKYHVKKGTMVILPMWHAHRSEHNWKDPDVFRAERFSNDENFPFYAYFPFAGGLRNCLGQRFALLSTTLTLANLIRKYEMELEEGYVLESAPTGPMQRPAGGVPMILKPRRRV